MDVPQHDSRPDAAPSATRVDLGRLAELRKQLADTLNKLSTDLDSLIGDLGLETGPTAAAAGQSAVAAPGPQWTPIAGGEVPNENKSSPPPASNVADSTVEFMERLEALKRQLSVEAGFDASGDDGQHEPSREDLADSFGIPSGETRDF